MDTMLLGFPAKSPFVGGLGNITLYPKTLSHDHKQNLQDTLHTQQLRLAQTSGINLGGEGK